MKTILLTALIFMSSCTKQMDDGIQQLKTESTLESTIEKSYHFQFQMNGCMYEVWAWIADTYTAFSITVYEQCGGGYPHLMLHIPLTQLVHGAKQSDIKGYVIDRINEKSYEKGI